MAVYVNPNFFSDRDSRMAINNSVHLTELLIFMSARECDCYEGRGNILHIAAANWSLVL